MSILRLRFLRAYLATRKTIVSDGSVYLKRDLRIDAVAGLTVAVMGVPQAMAYAMIAGVPPVYGLYTGIVCCIVAACFGSSSHLVTGPTNAMCMVLLSLTHHIPHKYPGVSQLEAVLLLTFMVGVIQLAFGLLRMGAVVRYVSNSVVVGFTAGAGILIAGTQLSKVMGVQIPLEHAERFYEVLYKTVEFIPESNPYSLLVGSGTIALLVLIPRISRRIPGPLTAVVLWTMVVYLTKWYDPSMGAHKVAIVRDIEPISRSLDIAGVPAMMRHPSYELTRELGSGAFALALLGLIEAASIARAIAATSGQRLDFNREFTAQGMGNIVGSFFSSFAGSGSFTRSAVCYGAGARTRMAAIFSGLWTLATIVLLAPLANYIPTACLAGMLIVIAYRMIEKHRFRLAWTSGANSRVVLFGTLFSTLLFPLEYAIFVGVFLSIFFLLKITGRTDLTQLVPRSDSGFDEVPFNRAAPAPIVTVNLEGDLYFAAVEDLEYELQRALTPQTRVVVLRMKRLRAVGSTAMAILEHFWQMLRARGVHLVVSGLEPQLVTVITNSGLRGKIGEANIFFADNKLFQSTELAMARAMSMVEMERRREEAAALEGEQPPALRGLRARDVMSRACIRFGNQHQLREAVWLLSEMNKRRPSVEPPSLFLQDREGRLAGRLSSWRLLREMTEGVDMRAMASQGDDALGAAMARNMNHPICDMVDCDLPDVRLDTPLSRILPASRRLGLRVAPVLDDGNRVMGLIGQIDLVKAVGRMLGLKGNGPAGLR